MATPQELELWADEAALKAKAERERVQKARRQALTDWVSDSWAAAPGRVYAWCKKERGPQVLATIDGQGQWLLAPDSVASEAVRQWSGLWKPGAQ